MRQHSHIATTCCVVAVLGSATLSAQQPPATRSPRAAPAAPAAEQADPWSLKPFLRLFGDAGRDHKVRWASRTLDCDVVHYSWDNATGDP